MRLAVLILSLALWPASALAEPLKVAKGMWSVTTDIYFLIQNEGEDMGVPPEHTAVEECWATEQEVTIDESMAAFFPGCVSTGTHSQSHSFDMDLSCNFEGIPITGVAEFAVNKPGDQFSGRLFLSGLSGALSIDAEALILGHSTGTCSAPN